MTPLCLRGPLQPRFADKDLSMTSMQAFRLLKLRHSGALVEVDIPSVGAGQVRLKVAGSGVCHSDLHVMHAPFLPWSTPFTLGHETTGWVDAVGSSVRGIEVGNAYAVYGSWGCGVCRPCQQGAENYCLRANEIAFAGPGLGRDGGMAEYLLVDQVRQLVPLGDLEPVAAAPLLDAALTPYHAIRRSLERLRAGTTTVVIGVGGLGHLAVQLLRALSATQIIAVDSAADKRALALKLGAHEALDFGQNIRAELADLLGGTDLVIDFVGVDSSMALAADLVSRDGDVTIVGHAGGSLPLDWLRMQYGARVSFPYWGTRPELMDVLQLARSGVITPEIERIGLEDLPAVYERLSAGTQHGRAVVVPGG